MCNVLVFDFWTRLFQNLNSILFLSLLENLNFSSCSYPLSGPLNKGYANVDCQKRKAQCMFSFRTNPKFSSRATLRNWRTERANVCGESGREFGKSVLPLCVLSVRSVMTKHTYLHTYILAYIPSRTYIQTYIHTYIHAYLRAYTYIHTYLHKTHTYIHKTHTYIHTHIDT